MYIKKLSDEIKLAYHNGRPTDDSPIDDRRVNLMIIKAINKLIKAEHMNLHLPLGENTPPNAALATYTVDVEAVEGAKQVVTVCQTFGEFGFTQNAWATEDDEEWETDETTPGDGDPWVVSTQSTTIDITQVSGDEYTILIGPFTLPSGKYVDDLIEFIEAGGDNSYIELVGPQDTVPRLFACRAISGLLCNGTYLKFTYTIPDSFSIDSDIFATVGETNNLLTATTSFTGENFTSIKRCDSTVYDNRGIAKLTLPTQPISLKRGMGVWRIYSPYDPFSSFIPAQAGEMAILKGITHNGLSNVLGRLTAYEWHSHKTIYFNKRATELPSQLEVQLVVVDPDTVGETDLLPIPADMEQQVVLEVLEQLRAETKTDLATNNNAEQ